MRWQTNFFYFSFKWTATAAIGIHPTKAWLSELVNFKYVIWYLRRTICNKIVFLTWKKCIETYGTLQTAFGPSCMNRASVFEWHKRLKEGKKSVSDNERCGRRKEVNRQELIGQRVRVRVTMLRSSGRGLLCWGVQEEGYYVKGVQEEVPSEEASTLQIGSVAFQPGQCTSLQLLPCHRLFD